MLRATLLSVALTLITGGLAANTQAAPVPTHLMKPAKVDPARLVGRWRAADPKPGAHIVTSDYQAGGVLVCTVTGDGIPTAMSEFGYAVANDTLTWTQRLTDGGEAVQTATITRLTETELALTVAGGEQQRLVRHKCE